MIKSFMSFYLLLLSCEGALINAAIDDGHLAYKIQHKVAYKFGYNLNEIKLGRSEQL